MLHRGVIFSAVVLALGVTASAQTVHTDADKSAKFGEYKSFCLKSVHTSSPSAETVLKDDLTKDLTAKGWQASDSGCDVTVVSMAMLSDPRKYGAYYDEISADVAWKGKFNWGPWNNGMSVMNTGEIPMGLVVLDLYDTQSKKLIYRGTSPQQLDSSADKNAATLGKIIDKLVKAIPAGKK